MPKTPVLLIRLDSVKKAPALESGGRGEQKILVTRLYPKSEVESTSAVWKAGNDCAATPVQIMADVEVAIFNHRASQSRHFHKLGTEIYTVLEGAMIIEVEGIEYTLKAGDTIVVNPEAAHQVISRGNEFVCKVVAVHCEGIADKYEI